MPHGKKTSTAWVIWLPLRNNLSTDAQRVKSQDFSHKWTSQLTSNLSQLLNFHTRLTGAHKALFQLLKIKATVDHAGHLPPLLSLSPMLLSLLDCSSIFLLNKSQHVLLTLTNVEVKATATVQLLKSLLTMLLKARACMRSSNTLTPHTTVLKAHAQYQSSKLQKFKFQASLSLQRTTILNCWTLLLNLVQSPFQLMLALGTLMTAASTMVATKQHPTLTTLSF